MYELLWLADDKEENEDNCSVWHSVNVLYWNGSERVNDFKNQYFQFLSWWQRRKMHLFKSFYFFRQTSCQHSYKRFLCWMWTVMVFQGAFTYQYPQGTKLQRNWTRSTFSLELVQERSTVASGCHLHYCYCQSSSPGMYFVLSGKEHYLFSGKTTSALQ